MAILGPTTDNNATRNPDGLVPLARVRKRWDRNYCRDGYHCTCHPYVDQRCCGCGTDDFTVRPLQ
jgi:hypothetical protein